MQQHENDTRTYDLASFVLRNHALHLKQQVVFDAIYARVAGFLHRILSIFFVQNADFVI